MSYGTGPSPYGDQAPYGGPAPYPGDPTPYGAPNQFGQFGPPPLAPDIAPLPGASFGEAVKRFSSATPSSEAMRPAPSSGGLRSSTVSSDLSSTSCCSWSLVLVRRRMVPQTMSGPVSVSG